MKEAVEVLDSNGVGAYRFTGARGPSPKETGQIKEWLANKAKEEQ